MDLAADSGSFFSALFAQYKTGHDCQHPRQDKDTYDLSRLSPKHHGEAVFESGFRRVETRCQNRPHLPSVSSHLIRQCIHDRVAVDLPHLLRLIFHDRHIAVVFAFLLDRPGEKHHKRIEPVHSPAEDQNEFEPEIPVEIMRQLMLDDQS